MQAARNYQYDDGDELGGWPAQRLFSSLRIRGIRDAAVAPGRSSDPVMVPFAADPAPATARPASGGPRPLRAVSQAPRTETAGHTEHAEGETLCRLEERLFKVINQERLKASLAPLVLEPALRSAARERARTLAAGAGFQPAADGTAFFDLLHNHKIRFRWAGENVARNACSDRWSVIVAAADLMGSTRHRENILAPFFTRVGVGMAAAMDGTKYFAMLFTD